MIPKCRFLANVTPQGDSIPPLKHRVKLIGTKLPYDYLTFNISPGMYVLESPHTFCKDLCTKPQVAVNLISVDAIGNHVGTVYTAA